MTQLHNRRYFEEHLNRSWSVHERLKAKIAVAFIDIDCFKLYNDHYGHLEGDTALRLVAQKISSFFSRDSDIVARYGGEEFVIVSSLQNDAPPFIERAEKMRQAIYDLAIKHEKSKVSECVTVSLGVCTGVPPARSTPSLFTRKADAAMYQAKHLGGNNTVHTEF
ncbi:diguanylate cyclase [Acinetobacter sp. ACNIH1]|uniref:diguanylate cyclase n=1 Tax=Acinetobacter sp. ACNIH1 TaxID=1636603 RepID=UPI002244F61D|nr:diguanylate cyclase [Acinetobacter sp. ACNIH1]